MPFTFTPNTLIDVWKRDSLPLANLPAPDYEGVPARLLKPYVIFGGALDSGFNNFFHRLHIHPDVPCGEIITQNSDNQNWTFVIHLDPPRLYYRFRYGGTIRESGLAVCHYVLAWPHYRQ